MEKESGECPNVLRVRCTTVNEARSEEFKQSPTDLVVGRGGVVCASLVRQDISCNILTVLHHQFGVSKRYSMRTSISCKVSILFSCGLPSLARSIRCSSRVFLRFESASRISRTAFASIDPKCFSFGRFFSRASSG